MSPDHNPKNAPAFIYHELFIKKWLTEMKLNDPGHYSESDLSKLKLQNEKATMALTRLQEQGNILLETSPLHSASRPTPAL